MTIKQKSFKLVLFLMAFVMLCSVFTTSIYAASNPTYSYDFGIAFSKLHAGEIRSAVSSTTSASEYVAKEHSVTLISGQRYDLYARSKVDMNVPVEYTVDDETVGRVYYGAFRASNPGVVNLVATYRNKKAAVKVNVVDKIDLKEHNIHITEGKMAILDLGLTEDDKYLYHVEWTSDDENVAYVAENIVYGHNVGKAKLTGVIYWRELSGTKEARTEIATIEASVTVYPRVESTTFAIDEKELFVGETFTPEYSVTPADGNLPVFFVSDDPKIASVDENGKITAVSSGHTFIRLYSASFDNNKMDTVGKAYNSIMISVVEKDVITYKTTINSNIASFVTIDKDKCYEGDKVTLNISAAPVVYDDQVEYYGMSSIYAIDNRGMIVELTKENDTTYSYIMPAGDVSIDGIFSLRYKVACSVSEYINLSRDNNVIGHLTITEYDPNVITEQFNISFGDIKIASVSADAGSYIINEDGSATIDLDANRSSASISTYTFYANRQDIGEDTAHPMNVSGASTLTSAKFVTAVRNVIPEDAAYISANDVTSNVINVRADNMIIIDSDVIDIIKSQGATLMLDLNHYVVTIPAISLVGLNIDAGSYISIISHSNSVLFSDEGKYRSGEINVAVYNADGSSRDVTNAIGNCTLSTSYTPNYNLQLEVRDSLYDFDSDANSGKYTIAVSSLSSLETFSLYANVVDNKFDDIIYIVIVVLLISALIVALMFLVKRILINKEEKKPDEPAIEATDNNAEIKNENNVSDNNDETEHEESNMSDDEAFKTVDEVLNEVNGDDSGEISESTPSDN